jgi:spectinomycin phosphotransferase
MRDDPRLDLDHITLSLETHYGLRATSITFIPTGHDMYAFVYRVAGRDGSSSFLKVRAGAVYEPALSVPRALLDQGIETIIAPLPTSSGELWCPLNGYDGYTIVLYPYIRGENAMIVGLSRDQWSAFGVALSVVHGSGLESRFRDQLRIEDFALPSAAKVRRWLELVHGTQFESPAANRFAAFWRAQAGEIERVLDRAESLGRSLHAKRFDLVLCHSDIHTANILVGDDGRIWLVDWDSPLIAPRERDLLFVVGSRIARRVEPEDEDAFFEGYGPFEIDPEALIYYRYERIVEDIGEFGQSVFQDPTLSERAREGEAALGMSFFEPGGDIERAESVLRTRWPNSSA